MDIKNLIEKKNALLGDMEKIVNSCVAEVRSFSEAEQEKYNKCKAELDGIEKAIKAAGEIEEKRKYKGAGEGGSGKPGKAESEEIEIRAFAAYIRGKIDSDETRAANMTYADNGAVIPKSIARKIVKKIEDISPLFAMATRYNVGGSLTIPIYDETAQKITMAYATEFTDLTSSSGKFTSVTLTGFLAGALCMVSKSLINNSDFDLVSFVVTAVAESAAKWIDNELINGTPEKIVGLSAAPAAVTAASAAAITADELIDLQESIPDKYQAGCIWLMHKSTRTAIRKLKDKDGNYILNKDATAKWGYTLFGHDVYVSENAPAMEASAAAVYYLDPQGLAVKLSENPNIEVLREKYAAQHALGVICWLEMDSKIEDAQKIAKLAMAGA